MKATITVQIPSGARILVSEDEKVTDATLLAKIDEEEESTPLDLAKILKIKPSSISKYLTRKIGEAIEEGDIVAVKKSVFSQTAVKSPHAGTIYGMDLATGVLVIQTKKSVPKKVISPVSGKIKSIKSNSIEVETEAIVYEGIMGSGNKVRGFLKYISDGRVGVMDGMEADFGGVIAMVGNLTAAAMVKFDVLGVTGIVALNKMDETNLPFVQFDRGVFEKIAKYDGKMAVLDPNFKRVYFLES